MVNCDLLKSIFKGLILFVLCLFVSEVLSKIVSFIGGLIAPVDPKLARSPLTHLLRLSFHEKTSTDDSDFLSDIIFQPNIAVAGIASIVVHAVAISLSKTLISILAFCLVPCPFVIWLLVDSCVNVFNIVMVSIMFFLYVFTTVILVYVIMERTNANDTGKNIHRVR